MRSIEVKGRVAGASTVTVTKNEILYSPNKPDDFILATVEFHEDGTHRAYHVRRPFHREPDFGVTSVNYDLAELLARAEGPQRRSPRNRSTSGSTARKTSTLSSKRPRATFTSRSS